MNNSTKLVLGMAIVLMAVTLIPSLAPEVQAADGTSSGDANDLASIVNGTDGDVVTIDLDKDTTYTLTGNSSITKTSVTINGNGATLELASSVQFNAGNGGNDPDSKLVINDLKIVSDESTVKPIGITFYNWTSVTFDKLDVTNTTVATNDTSNTQTKTNVVEHCTFKGFKDQSARYYALTLNSSTVEVSDCHFYDYSCGLNINMVDGDADSSVTVNGCTFNNMQGKAAVQLGGSVSPSIVLEGNKFLTCSRAAVSIHNGAVGSTTVTSMNNIYSDCGMEFMYCASTSGVKVVSVSDQFSKDGTASDPVIGGETTSVKPPVSNVSVSDGYDPSTGNMTIDSIGDLMAFAAMVNGGNDFQNKTVTLESDLTLSGEWTPIGDGTRSGNTITGNVFRGTFDGQGNTITGMTISTHSEEGVGLFAYLVGGTVKNLTLSNPSITTTQESTGAVVGAMTNGAQIIDVHVESGSVNGTEGVGGIVGRILSSGSVTDCSNSATVEATVYNAGGIAGAAYYNNVSMTISGCTNDGIVKSAQCAGGIVGLCSGAVTGCTNNGEVTGNGISVGGIVGEQQNSGSITDSTNNGKVTNTSTAYGTGGVVGWVRYSGADNYPDKSIITISNAKNYGDVDSEGTGVGGIVGMVYHSVVMNGCTSDATISGSNMVAGIVGGVQTTDSNHTPDFCRLVFIDNHSAGRIDCAGTIRTMVGHLTGFTQGNECTLSHGSRVTEMGNTSDIQGETGFGDFATVATIDFDGETYGYENLQSAIDAVQDGGTITMVESVEDVVLDSNINPKAGIDFTIDLNGVTLDFGDTYRIVGSSGNGKLTISNGTLDFGHPSPIQVMGYTLELVNCKVIGTGYTTANDGTTSGTTFIWMFGSADSSAEEYSNLIVDSDTEFVFDNNSVDLGAYVVNVNFLNYGSGDPNNVYAAYGVTVDFAGKMTGNIGCAFYVNGNVKPTDGNVPKIHIDMSDEIKTGGGIYAAGYAEWDIDGCNFEAYSAISIKSGTFDISGGVFHATGEFADPPVVNNNGSEDTGAAISITSNSGYPQKTVVNISGGTFTSDNGYAVYEGIAKKADGTYADDASYATISISRGDFKGNSEKGDVKIDWAENTKVIIGGTYSSDVSDFVADGFAYDEVTGGIVFDTDSYEAAVYDSEGNFVKAYATLAEAVGAATDGQTVRLQKDVELTSMLEISKSGITIDLNKHTISASDSFDNGGDDNYSANDNLVTIMADNVTIRNGTLESKAANTNVLNVYGCTGVVVEDLVIDNSANDSNDPMVINNSGVIFGGDVIFIPYDKSNSYGINVGGSNATCSIEFKDGTNLTFQGCDYGIYLDFIQNPTTTVTYGDNVTYYYPGSDSFAFIFDLRGDLDENVDAADGTNPDYTITFSETNGVKYIVTVTSADGTTPYYAESDGSCILKAGDYVATFTADGYDDLRYEFTGTESRNHTVTMTQTPIEPISKEVTVTVKPEGASITVISGGDVVGSGTGSVKVTMVFGQDYTVELSMDGYESASYTFMATAETNSILSYTLSAIEPEDPDTPVYPPFIPGGDDDVVIPPTVVVDQGSSDDDEAVKIVACAACAVVAAFLAAVMLFHRRD